jgi:hypothetical protein
MTCCRECQIDSRRLVREALDRWNVSEARRYRQVKSVRPVRQLILVPITRIALDDFDWWNGLAASESPQYFEDPFVRRDSHVGVVLENANQLSLYTNRTNIRYKNFNGFFGRYGKPGR